MTSRIRTAALALVATIALVSAPLLVAGSASATTTGDVVVMFSNSSFTDTDPGQEDDQTFAALDASGATVTLFDGGDGSDTAWTTALAGADYLVFPEMGPSAWSPGGTSAMSDAAAQVVKDFINAGGHVIFTGAYGAVDFFSFFSGLDYSGAFSTGSPSGPYAIQGVNAALPSALAAVDYSGDLIDFGSWSAELKAPMTPLYVSASGGLAVGTWTLGSGTYSYVAYDWFPDTDDIDAGTVEPWNIVLTSLPFTLEPFPVPVLAETGSAISLPLIGAGAFVLLTGAALMLVARRRARRA